MFLAQGASVLNFQRDGNSKKRRDIMDFLKLKDDMRAALANSLKAVEDRKSDHTTLVQVKENEEVATLTATIETNLRQGDIATEVSSFSGEEASFEWEEKRQRSRVEGLRRRVLMWRLSPDSMRDDLENIYMLLLRFFGNRLPAGALQHELACDPGVRRSRCPIRSASRRGPVLFGRGEPCDRCQDTAHVVVSCSSCPMTCHKCTRNVRPWR